MDIKNQDKYLGHSKRVNTAANETLKAFDANKDGAIDLKSEVKTVYSPDSVEIPNYRQLKAEEALKADSNQDDSLSLAEIKDFFNQKIIEGNDSDKGGSISALEKFRAALASVSPASELDSISETKELSSVEIKEFIDQRIDAMGENAARELVKQFDRKGLFVENDEVIDLSFESQSKDFKFKDSYPGIGGGSGAITENIVRRGLSSAFIEAADANKDGKIFKAEVKEYVKQSLDADGNGAVDSGEYLSKKEFDKDFIEKVSLEMNTHPRENR